MLLLDRGMLPFGEDCGLGEAWTAFECGFSRIRLHYGYSEEVPEIKDSRESEPESLPWDWPDTPGWAAGWSPVRVRRCSEAGRLLRENWRTAGLYSVGCEPAFLRPTGGRRAGRAPRQRPRCPAARSRLHTMPRAVRRKPAHRAPPGARIGLTSMQRYVLRRRQIRGVSQTVSRSWWSPRLWGWRRHRLADCRYCNARMIRKIGGGTTGRCASRWFRCLRHGKNGKVRVLASQSGDSKQQSLCGLTQ